MEVTLVVVEELIRSFYENLWNRWDDDAAAVLLDDDFTFRGSLGVETRGHAAWRSYRDAVRAGAPDFHNEVVALDVNSRQAAARLRYRGTHLGALAGRAPTGRRFEYSGAAFFVSDGHRLTSAVILGDLVSLNRQLS